MKSFKKSNKNGDFFIVSPLGARVQALIINGESILREDDGSNPKRSGIPILGPIVDANCGIWPKIAPNMPQHGTDRITNWEVTEETATSLTFKRTYDGIDHPLMGEAMIRIAIDTPHTFTIERKTTHRGTFAVPLGTGLHTYFLPLAQFSGLDVFTVENKKTYLLPGAEEVTMVLDGNRYIIRTEPATIHTVVWTENGHDHICVEPWWAEIGNAPMIKPGETRIELYSISRAVDN